MEVEEKSLEAAARNSSGENGEQRTSKTPQETWLGRAQKGSLWLCYAWALIERQNVGSQVIGEDPSRLSERGTVGEIRRGGRRASNRTKEKIHRFRVSFG